MWQYELDQKPRPYGVRRVGKVVVIDLEHACEEGAPNIGGVEKRFQCHPTA